MGPIGQLRVLLFGSMAQPMSLGVVDDLHLFVRTSITMKTGRCNVRLCAARGLYLGAAHGNYRGSGGGLHATIGSSRHVECIEYMLVHQHGAKSTEIGSSGHVGCIKTNKYISWCTSRGAKMLKLADQDMWNASNKKTIDLGAPPWGQEYRNWQLRTCGMHQHKYIYISWCTRRGPKMLKLEAQDVRQASNPKQNKSWCTNMGPRVLKLWNASNKKQ